MTLILNQQGSLGTQIDPSDHLSTPSDLCVFLCGQKNYLQEDDRRQPSVICSKQSSGIYNVHRGYERGVLYMVKKS